MARSKYGKRRGSKPRHRRFRKGRKAVLVNRALQPIAQRYITKMKYSDIVTTSVTGEFALNLNSIFDPNRSGIGHQPYGHDQLQTLYNRYRVISCSYRLQMLLGSGAPAVTMAALPSNEVISGPGIDYFRESPRAKYVSQLPGATLQTLTGKVYLPSLVGRTKSQYMADDRYQAEFGSSPLELAVLNILTATPSGSGAGNTVQVVMEYAVECFDIKPLSGS